MTRLAEMFNVNHFIVSQVNPHVVPFLIKEEDSVAQEAQQSTASLAAAPSWVHSFTHLAKGEALHRMHIMAEMGIFPNTLTKAVSVLSQKYSGDITIFPEISYADFPRMLSNPTPEFMVQAQLCGERATWPKLSRIRNHCAIELALDETVQKLRTRVVFSSSQADLRLGGYVRSNSDGRSRRSLDNTRGSSSRRKMSQHSDTNPFTAVDASKEVKIDRLRQSQHHKSHSINHYIMPATGTAPTYPPTPPTSDSAFNESLSLPKFPQPDIVSSGAETSNFSASDSASDTSSPIESPYSTTSPALPDLWPQSGQLFPHATQPNTPSDNRQRSAIWSPLATRDRDPSKSHSTRTTSRSGSSTRQAPLSPAAPSSPERTYKRLFHGVTSRIRSTDAPSPPSTVPSPSLGVKRFNAIGLQIDVSGTRGMVLRKKRGD